MTDSPSAAPAKTPPPAPPGPSASPPPPPGGPPAPPSAGPPAPPRAAVGVLPRAAVPLAVLGGVAAAFGWVAAVDPNSPGHYPVCPLLHYTGLYCPGCGGLRGAYALAHGHLGTALGCNAAAVAGYLVFAVLWTVWFTRTLRGRPFEPGLRPAYLWAVGGLVLAFSIVRNLPVGAALVP